MATITSSAYALGHQQANGTRYVTETHTWDGGLPPTVLEYGPVPDTVDYQAAANARAVQIMAAMADAEARSLMDGS